MDTSPYPGGITTCEAMWMGVPTVTAKGENFLSSVGATMAKSSERPQLCAVNPEEYIEKAIRLAENIELLNDTRLASRSVIISTALFDGKRFANKFTDLLTSTVNN